LTRGRSKSAHNITANTTKPVYANLNAHSETPDVMLIGLSKFNLFKFKSMTMFLSFEVFV
ncbi:hypothetical protein OAP51_06780, partial [Alphaproteobacteria bacterium]|nr:hypothetical protein [Alphaproteobacteria bacterium]